MPRYLEPSDALDPLLLALVPLLQEASIHWFAHREQFGWDDDTLLPSATQLAKTLNADSDKVKKRLQRLRLMDLVCVCDAQPKRYRWDPYHWNHLASDHPLKEALTPVLDSASVPEDLAWSTWDKW